jgi:hypothetical protein
MVLLGERKKFPNEEKVGFPKKGIYLEELTEPCNGDKVVSLRKVISPGETLWPRKMMFLGIVSQPHFQKSVRMKLTFPK